MKKYLPFIFECIFLFYLIPILISFTPLISGLNEMISLVINIFLLTIFSLFYSRSHRFSVWVPVIVATLFAIAGIILSYSPIRIVFFASIYTLVSLVGEILGLMFKKETE